MSLGLGDTQNSQLLEVLGAGNSQPDGSIVGFASHWASLVPESPALRRASFRGGDYLLATSPFSQICDFRISPAFWWPKECTWIVVTHSDLESGA